MTSCIISGGSGVGKTWICLEMIRRRKSCFKKSIDSVVYVFKNWQEQFEEFKEDKEVYFIQDLFETDSIVSRNPNKSFLIFIDDQIISFENDKTVSQYVEEFFVFRAHHQNLHPVFICHNIFSKSLRLVSLNTGLLIVFRNLRDSTQLSILGNQLGYGNFLKETLKKIVSENVHGFLVIDLNKYTPDKLRFRNFLWRTNNMKYFVPKEK